MGFDEETVEKMYLAGALHDIGKVAVGNEILEKPGRLTEDEFAVMKHHAAYTYYILSDIDDFDEIRAAFAEARATKGMPTAIIAKTLKGKGVSFMENAVDWHGKAPNDDEYKIAMEDLEKAGAALCQN